LHNIEKKFKHVTISQEPGQGLTRPSLSDCSLQDLASSFTGKTGSSIELPSFDKPVSNQNTTNQLGSSRLKGGLGLNHPSFDTRVSDPFGAQGGLNQTFSSVRGGLGFKLPSFGSPAPNFSNPETSSSTGLSLSELASMHLKSGSALGPPEMNLNFGCSEEPLSLSALAAQHQNSMKSEHENTSLLSLAAEHLRNAGDNNQQFFIPRLSSPPAKTERSFSPVFRGESPVEPNSEPIDLLGALNPPENRTKLEHPRVTWMDTEDDDDDDQFIPPDQTCLLDRAAQGNLTEVDSALCSDQSSPLGRILCERFTAKRTFTFHIAARYEGSLKRFSFDCPSPDDIILIRLGRKLPS